MGGHDAGVLRARRLARRALRLHVLSDLHLERPGAQLPPRVACDVVVLAGDVGDDTAGLRAAAAWWPDRPVLYVSGNHEPYGGALPDVVARLRAAAPPHVHVLEDDALVLGGVRFLGCTLWSDFLTGGEAERADAMTICERVVNDYTHVRWSPEDRILRARDTLALHERSRAWLAARLAEPFDGPTVVITHHAPLPPPVRIEDPLRRAIAGAFASDMTALMGAACGPELWIFGHTHRHADTDVAGTRVLSNPRGYPEQDVPGYDPALVVEVGSATAG